MWTWWRELSCSWRCVFRLCSHCWHHSGWADIRAGDVKSRVRPRTRSRGGAGSTSVSLLKETAGSAAASQQSAFRPVRSDDGSVTSCNSFDFASVSHMGPSHRRWTAWLLLYSPSALSPASFCFSCLVLYWFVFLLLWLFFPSSCFTMFAKQKQGEKWSRLTTKNRFLTWILGVNMHFSSSAPEWVFRCSPELRLLEADSSGGHRRSCGGDADSCVGICSGLELLHVPVIVKLPDSWKAVRWRCAV